VLVGVGVLVGVCVGLGVCGMGFEQLDWSSF
jgi:hypothetical protein